MATKPLIKEALFFINFCGLNPVNQNLNKKIVTIITITLITYFIIELTLDLVLKWKGLKSVDSFTVYFGIFLVLIKTIVLIIKSDKIRNLLKLLTQFWSLNDYDLNLQYEIKNILKISRILIIIYGVAPVICIGGYIFLPLFKVNRTLPFQTYHPFDYYNYYYYQAMYALQVIDLIIAFLVMYGFDILFLSFITHIICEYKILKHQFLNIKTQDEHLLEAKPLIDHHNLILRCIKNLDNIYSKLFLIQFLFSLFTICTGLLNIIVDGITRNLNSLLVHIGFLFACSGQLLVYCVAGAYLKSESESISDSVYNSDWWIKTQPKLRRAYSLIIQRAQKGEELTAGGMFSLNLISFTKILKTSLSFFMLAQALFVRSRNE